MLRFDSDIKISSGNIFAIGDIHGDVRALIICLRDLCHVIKSTQVTEKDLRIREDGYMVDMLSRDVPLDDRLYDQTLGYKWIGGDSIVVLNGDLLDNLRVQSGK
jgi:hypothetical protein